MLRRTLFTLALATLFAPATFAAETADQIVAKHVQALGGKDKLAKVQTRRITGKMEMGQGMEAPIVIETKRPNKSRTEFTIQGLTGVQAYDGKTAWMVMPFMGKKDPEAVPAEEAKLIEEQSEFDSPLVDYRTKGHKVELLGKEQVEGADAYKLKLKLKNGVERTVFLDAETYLEVRQEGKRTMRGTETEYEMILGDYKAVDGLMVAHSIQAGAKGSPMKQTITIEKVEQGMALDDSRFAMPAMTAAPADSAQAAGSGEAPAQAVEAEVQQATDAADKADAAATETKQATDKVAKSAKKSKEQKKK